MPRKIAAGNWKMHGVSTDLTEAQIIGKAAVGLKITTLLCLPATLIDRARKVGVALGGQDCHVAKNGAHTGDVSAAMLADAGAFYVIVGHSERRADHGESNADVAAKARAAWEVGLVAVICIGETEDEYRDGRTLDVLKGQIAGSVPEGATPDNTVVAYEPVWAIGTGLTPTIDEIDLTHRAIRAELAARLPEGGEISLLYGGSVKPANAAEIFAAADVDGGLVGGASLTAADFVPIMKALEGSTK